MKRFICLAVVLLVLAMVPATALAESNILLGKGWLPNNVEKMDFNKNPMFWLGEEYDGDDVFFNDIRVEIKDGKLDFDAHLAWNIAKICDLCDEYKGYLKKSNFSIKGADVYYKGQKLAAECNYGFIFKGIDGTIIFPSFEHLPANAASYLADKTFEITQCGCTDDCSCCEALVTITVR